MAISAETLEKRFTELGIALPQVAMPVANYVPFVLTGQTLFLSGQLPLHTGQLMTGKLGHDVTIEHGYQAARQCALNLLAWVHHVCTAQSLKIQQCVKLVGFVQCLPDFFDHPKVMNGASDLMVEMLGENGKHARSAVGVPSLPLQATVEVEAIFTLVE